jgi:hypothetical protein
MKYITIPFNRKADVLNHIGKHWGHVEESRLVNRFMRGMRVEIMCRVHRRDVGGIISRLERLGLIINTGRNLIRKDNREVFMTYDDVKTLKTKINIWVIGKLGGV